MAKEKTDSNKQGWFARWRDRRKQSKLRTGERQRTYDPEIRMRRDQMDARVRSPGGPM